MSLHAFLFLSLYVFHFKLVCISIFSLFVSIKVCVRFIKFVSLIFSLYAFYQVCMSHFKLVHVLLSLRVSF